MDSYDPLIIGSHLNLKVIIKRHYFYPYYVTMHMTDLI